MQLLKGAIEMDAGYTDYPMEDDFFEAGGIIVRVQRKSNTKVKDEHFQRFLKEYMRKAVEINFSQIKVKMLRCIHAVTKERFLFKVALFFIAYAFYKIAFDQQLEFNYI